MGLQPTRAGHHSMSGSHAGHRSDMSGTPCDHVRSVALGSRQRVARACAAPGRAEPTAPACYGRETATAGSGDGAREGLRAAPAAGGAVDDRTTSSVGTITASLSASCAASGRASAA